MMPLELCVLAAMVAGFLLVRKSEGKWFSRQDPNGAQTLARRMEKAIHRNFHTGRPGAVLETFTEAREKKAWLSRVALELVLRSMIAEEALDAPSMEQYIRQHYPKEKEQVRTITNLVEACASRMHLDCIVEIMKAREATGVPFSLARLGSYLTVLGAFAGVGREQEVQLLFQAIENSEGGIPHRAFVVGIMGLLKSGSLWAALRTMRLMEEHRLAVPNQCLVSLFKAGVESNEASSLLEQALTLNTSPPADALLVLAQCAEGHDDTDLAEKVAALCRGNAAKALVPLLALFARRNSHRALEVFEEMAVKQLLTADLCQDVLQVCEKVAPASAQLLRVTVDYCKESQYLDSASPYAPRLLKAAVAAAEKASLRDLAKELQEEQERMGLGESNDTPDVSPHARRALDEFRDLIVREPNARHDYAHHLRLAAEYADTAYATEVLETMMQKFGPKRCCDGRGSALTTALTVFVRTGQLQAGFSLLLQNKDHAEAESWNTILTAFCSGGHASAAKKCWEEMQSAPAVVNDASHNCLLSVLLWDGAFEEARELLLTMSKSGEVSPTTVQTLTKALQAASFEGGVPEAAPWQDNSEGRRLVQRTKFVKEAAGLLLTARQDDLTEEVTKSLVNACLAVGAHRELDALLPRLPRVGMPTYMAVMKAYSAMGKVDDVLTAWVEMTKERRLVPSQVCLGQVLNVLASNGRPTAAQAMLSEWKDLVGANCVMYTTVIKGLARAKDFDRAMEMWHQMRREGVEPNVKAYNTLLDACARAGKIDTHGKEILEEMARKKIPVASVTVSTAVKGYCSKGLLAEAAASLGEAFGSMEMTQEGPTSPAHRGPEASAYNALLDGCVKAGDFARFDDTYKGMLDAGVKPSSFTLTALVKRYGNAGQLDAAFDTVKQVCSQHGGHLRNLHVATCLISACFRNRSPQRAFKFFEEVKQGGDFQPDAVTYATMINGTKTLTEDGLATAVKLATEALSKGGPGLPDYAVQELVERLACANQLAALGQQLVKNIEASGSPVPRAIASALTRTVAASVGVGQQPWKQRPYRSTPLSSPASREIAPRTTWAQRSPSSRDVVPRHQRTK
jgi:pentatricopeptide repeat protein